MQLAKRKYLELILKRLSNTKHMYEFFLEYDNETEKSFEEFFQNTKLLQLLQAYTALDTTIIQWQQANYNRNPNYPEHLTFKCPSGNIVRSKSEVFIDMVLNQHAIPYLILLVCTL